MQEQEYIDSRVNEEEKQELYIEQPAKSGLNTHHLGAALAILGAVLLLCLPKIYLSSTIYYKSKAILNLQSQCDMLSDENKRLKHELEDLRYEFLILK